jgi:hypothetical protein
MHFTLFTLRLVLGLLLVITLVAGWLLHGILFVPSNSTAENSLGVNSQLRSGKVPISSQLGTSTSNTPVDATRVPGDVPDETSREADRQLVEDVYGVDITQARPIDYVHMLAGHTAIFFINGDTDNITPLPGMQTLYQAASAPKQYWVVPNADHA